MIFARLPIIRAMFPAPDPALEAARRWVRAFRAEPEMQGDLIRLGGLLTLRAERYVEGLPAPDPIDPVRLAYEQGQRDMAVKLLALGGLTPEDFNTLKDMPDERPGYRNHSYADARPGRGAYTHDTDT